MRIALIGPGGTGKTTLAELFAKKHNYPLIPEFAREVAQELSIPDISKMTPAESNLFQSGIVFRKVAEESKHKKFIADRSLLDGYVYYILHMLRTDCSKYPDVELYKSCLEYTKNNYDLLLFIPPFFDHQDDGFRMSRSIESAAELLLLGLLHKEHIPYNMFNCPGTPEERLELLTKIVFLRERKKPA